MNMVIFDETILGYQRLTLAKAYAVFHGVINAWDTS